MKFVALLFLVFLCLFTGTKIEAQIKIYTERYDTKLFEGVWQTDYSVENTSCIFTLKLEKVYIMEVNAYFENINGSVTFLEIHENEENVDQVYETTIPMDGLLSPICAIMGNERKLNITYKDGDPNYSRKIVQATFTLDKATDKIAYREVLASAIGPMGDAHKPLKIPIKLTFRKL